MQLFMFSKIRDAAENRHVFAFIHWLAVGRAKRPHAEEFYEIADCSWAAAELSEELMHRLRTVQNGASLRIICIRNLMKILPKTVIISHAKYNANIPRIPYADPS